MNNGVIDSKNVEDASKWDMPIVGEQSALANNMLSANRSQQMKQNDEAYQHGLEQGFQAGQNKVNQLIAELNQLLAVIDEPMKLIEKQVEEELLGMVTELTKACVKAELTINPALITNSIEQLKKVLPSTTSEKTLMLNPEDHAYVSNLLEQGSITLQYCKLQANESLSRGECQLLSDTSEVDGTLLSRMMTITDKVFADTSQINTKDETDNV